MANDIATSLFTISDIIASKRVEQAQFNKTVKAVIVSCLDPTIGKYKVQYQDGFWYAYSENIDVNYPKGSYVYINIPNGDFNQIKHIVGAVNKVGVNYSHVQTQDEKVFSSEYDLCGELSDIDISLCSYKDQIKQLSQDSINTLNDLIDRLRSDNCIRMSALFRTQLPSEHINNNGNYGIQLQLEFYKEALQGNVDEQKSETIIRTLTLDIDSFINNPFILKVDTLQQKDFIIDNKNLKSIKGIKFFVNDFIKDDSTDHPDDIFISGLSIIPCHSLTDDQKQGVIVRVTTPQGNIFDKLPDDYDDLTDQKKRRYDQRKLNANVYVNGKLVNSDEQKLSFYWFKSDPGVLNSSANYNKYGGPGWRCLNPATLRRTGTYDFSPGSESYTVELEKDAKWCYENTFKCVVIYDRKSYSSNEITIKNLDASYKIYIQSDKGTQFSLGQGKPNLRCFVKDKQNHDVVGNFLYSWIKQDYEGYTINLAGSGGTQAKLQLAQALQTSLENEKSIYQNKDFKAELERIGKSSWLENYVTIFQLGDVVNIPNMLVKQGISNIKAQRQALENTQRVIDDHIYSVDVNDITKKATFRCGVYERTEAGIGDYIGAAALTLTNKDAPQAGYSLTITNGTQVFKYNEMGISPVSQALENQEEFIIESLTYTIRGKGGEEIQSDALEACTAKWYIPSSNTMIVYNNENELDTIHEYYIHQDKNLSFTIDDQYDVGKDRNDIKLQVNYGGFTLTASTNFTFLKTGQDGTNGTDFVCKLDVVGNKVYYPTLYIRRSYNNSTNSIAGNNWNGTNKVVGYLYKNNVPVTHTAKYKILKTGTDGGTGAPALNVDLQTGALAFDKNTTDIHTNVVDIIQLQSTYDGRKYFATLPIVISKPYYKNDLDTQPQFRINIKQYTGFKSVMYTSDGTFPSYDNRKPFEVIVEQRIEDTNVWEDISLMSNKVEYSWDCCGNLLYVRDDKLQANQHIYKPKDTYRDDNTIHGVYCRVTIDGNKIVEIYIPITMYLNRYGLDYLNDWDGNSISLNDDNGAILAPIVGAGTKNNNKFTGVLMGEVKQSGTDEIGLFGYHQGQRSIFLDSKTGKAQFGKNNKARISIDPSTTINGQPTALIYSGDYPISTFKDNPNVADISGSTGLMIDLSTPQIGFGSGAFYVNSSGHIHAAGGGDIAGWQVGIDSIHKDTSSTHVGMRSGTSNDINVNVPTGNGSTSKARAFYAGQNNNFYVTHDGYLRATVATIGSGTSLIYIGDNGNGNSAIFTFGKNKKDASNNGFYIGTDGFGLGTPLYGKNHSAFQVDTDGTLYITKGYIDGQNGSWTIEDSKLYTGSKSTIGSDAEGIFLSPDGIKLGSTFIVTKGGHLTTKSGVIGSWNINDDSISSGNEKTGIILDSNGSIHANYNNTNETGWSISHTGTAVFNSITANGGTIGGWTIGKNKSGNRYLKAGNLTLWDTGKLEQTGTNKWHIDASGAAEFSSMNITKGILTGVNFNSGTLSGSGVGVSGGGISGGTSYGSINDYAKGMTKGTVSSNTEMKNTDIYCHNLWAQGSGGIITALNNFRVGNDNGIELNSVDCDEYNLNFKGGILIHQNKRSKTFEQRVKDALGLGDKDTVATKADLNNYVKTSTYSNHTHSFSYTAPSSGGKTSNGTTGTP